VVLQEITPNIHGKVSGTGARSPKPIQKKVSPAQEWLGKFVEGVRTEAKSKWDGASDALAMGLQIGPAAARGALDIVQMLPGEQKLANEASKYLKRGMEEIRKTIGSKNLNEEVEQFENLLENEEATIGDMLKYLRDHPRVAANAGITNLGSLVLPGAIGKGATYLTKIGELKKINPAWFRKIAEEATGIVSSAVGIHSKLGEEKLKESDRYKGAAANALGNIAGGYGLPKLLEQFGKKTGMGKMTGKVLKDYQEGRIGAKQVEKFLIETAAGMGKDVLGAVNNVISLNAGSSQLYDLSNNPNNIAKLIVSEAGLNGGKTHAGKHQDRAVRFWDKSRTDAQKSGSGSIQSQKGKSSEENRPASQAKSGTALTRNETGTLVKSKPESVVLSSTPSRPLLRPETVSQAGEGDASLSMPLPEKSILPSSLQVGPIHSKTPEAGRSTVIPLDMPDAPATDELSFLNDMRNNKQVSSLVKRVMNGEMDGNKIISGLGTEIDAARPGLDPELRALIITKRMSDEGINNPVVREFRKQLGYPMNPSA
jgi:hypothetical protein